MKIITIGDTHGRDRWKEAVKEDFDKVIFIGDYFDSWDIPFDEQLQNWVDILQFKIENVDKVVLLIGNHDYHYMFDQQYSGYQHGHADTIGFTLSSAFNRGYLQACSVDDGFLFSHAGVTKTWTKFANINLDNLEGSINKCMILTPQMFKFMDYQGADNTGNNTYQSPIWVRPESLVQDKIEGYTQVVGHTGQDRIHVTEDVIFIDCPTQYLELNAKEITCHNNL